jgi:hypothetical protein
MPFCEKENLAEVSRKYKIPYSTLYGWLRTGTIVLPRDEEKLGQLKKNKQGRYYLKEKK